MNVWQIGGFSVVNFGDRVLQKSATKLLKDALPDQNLHFTYVDVQRTCFSDQFIDKLNREADVLWFGGGGFFFSPVQPNRSGWQLNVNTQDLAKIRIPMFGYGFGFNRFPQQPSFLDYTWDNINHFVRQCEMFSVRNTGTLRALQDGGIDISHTSVVPDAGMFVEPDIFSHTCFGGTHIKIGFNWASDRPIERFGSRQAASKALHQALSAVKVLADQHDARVYVLEHLAVLENNAEVKAEIRQVAQDILGNRCCVLYDELKEQLYPPFDYYAGFFAHVYSKFDLVLGMRGHSAIVSFGCGIPFIGLGTHNKVKWFLEDVGFGHHLVSQDYTRIVDLGNSIMANKNLKIDIKRVYNKMTGVKDQFMAGVSRCLRRTI